MATKKNLLILGTRGIPARHGGFETFAENLAEYLVGQGWTVSVYCQEEGKGDTYLSDWNGVKRVHVPVVGNGPLSTIAFDFKSVLHSLKCEGICLTLGYNTAVLGMLYRFKGKSNIINMDGIEWKRQKWGRSAKLWFWINERIACWFGNHLIADNPKIKEHLATRVDSSKITMIPYGGNKIESPNKELLATFGVIPWNYALVIARPEPENSILEIVSAFSAKKRNAKLIVLGDFDFENHKYHKKIKSCASEEVIFPGGIYECNFLNALRFFSRFYVHGHQVGGTNPSLVEALAAGNAALVYENPFNRWVAGDAAIYFKDEKEAASGIERLLDENDLVKSLKLSATIRHREMFQWSSVLNSYEAMLTKWLPAVS